jgi:hypothetical protein
MKVFVQIKEDTVEVACGTGRNKVSWLCHSAFHRVDKNYGLDLPMWTSLEDEAGTKIPNDAAIADKIRDGDRVVLKFDPVKPEESKAQPVPAPKKK